MAKRTMNKTQLVKEYFEKHPDAGPSEVAEALKKHKISPAYVSNIKFKIRHGKVAGMKGQPSLVAADLINACGGEEGAIAAIKETAQIARRVSGALVLGLVFFFSSVDAIPTETVTGNTPLRIKSQIFTDWLTVTPIASAVARL